MLSRTADSLYWMSRYLERAEHAARLLDVHINLALDNTPESAEARWQRVLACLDPATARKGVPQAASEATVDALAFDMSNRNSIVSCIMAARENARQVREQISSEMWEQINRLFHEVRRSGIEERRDAQPLEFLWSVREKSYLFQGITDSTMSHGEGWQFIQLGRFLERASATAIMLDVHFAEFSRMPDWDATLGDLEWVGLLRSCTAFEAYCKVYTAELRPKRIIEFVLLNEDFPHSVRFSVDHLQRALMSLAQASPSRHADRLRKLAGRLSSSLAFAQIDDVLAGDVHAMLEGVQRQCNQIHIVAHQIYISYSIQSALEA